MRRWGLVAVLLGAVVPMVSGAGSPAIAGAAGAVERPDTIGLRLERAGDDVPVAEVVRTALADAIERLLPAKTVSTSETAQEEAEHAWLPYSIPDMDGDGLADVLQGMSTSTRTRHEVRKGVNGALLYSFTSPHRNAVVVPVVGADEQTGFIAVWFDVKTTVATPVLEEGEVLFHIGGRDRHGAVVWDRDYRGSYRRTPAGIHMTDMPGIHTGGDVSGNGATDLVMSRETGVYAYPPFVGSSRRTSMAGTVVDGQTGQEGWAVSRDEPMAVGATPDLVGGPKQDLAVYTPSGLEIVDGQGEVHRTMPDAAPGPLVGDLTEDGTPELVVVGVDWSAPTGPARTGDRLVDVRSDAVLYSTSTGRLQRLGDVTGDGVPEAAHVVEEYLSDETAVAVNAIDARGHASLSRRFTIPRRPAFFDFTRIASDTDGDGVLDVVTTFISNQDFDRQDVSVLSVATGGLLVEGAGGELLGFSIDGHGDDFLHFGQDDTAVIDGRTLTRIWTVATPGQTSAVVGFLHDLNGDGFLEVAHRWVDGDSNMNSELRSGADGLPLWR